MAKTSLQPAGVEKLLYRREEAAFALGCSLRSIDYMIEAERLSTRKMGRNTVIPAADVKRVAQDITRGTVVSLRTDTHTVACRRR